jgi:hypothetical protein
MSTGSGIGGLFGAVAGIAAVALAPITGGASFAMYMTGASIGFTIGSAIGSFIDPVNTDTPDSPALGKPDVQQTSFTTCAEGLLIPDVYGMSRLTGNIFGYWNSRNEPLVQTSTSASPAASGKGGGKGGGGSQTSQQITGYKYYLTWAMGLCEGPVDGVYAIYKDNDKCVWGGTGVAALRTGMNAYGYTELIIPDFGTLRFYWGTANQSQDTIMQNYMGTANTPAYRNFCYVVFDDCYLGEYNRAPIMHFVVRKAPDCGTFGTPELLNWDCNSATVIYDILVNKLQIPSTYLDSSFVVAANTLYAEKFGISMLVDQYQSAATYMETVLNHIDGIITFTSEGKFALNLVRADKALADIPLIKEEYLLETPTFTRKSWLDTMNELKIQYTMRLNEPSSMYPDPLGLTGPTEISAFGDYTYVVTGGSGPYLFTSIGCDMFLEGASSVEMYVRYKRDFTVTVRDGSGQMVTLNVTYTLQDPENPTYYEIGGSASITEIGMYAYTFVAGVGPITWAITDDPYNYVYFENSLQTTVTDDVYVNVIVAVMKQSFVLTATDANGKTGQLWVIES